MGMSVGLSSESVPAPVTQISFAHQQEPAGRSCGAPGVGRAPGSVSPAGAERDPRGPLTGRAAGNAGVKLRKRSLERGKVFGAALGKCLTQLPDLAVPTEEILPTADFPVGGNTQSVGFAMDGNSAWC